MKVCVIQNNVLGTKLETFERIKSIPCHFESY